MRLTHRLSKFSIGAASAALALAGNAGAQNTGSAGTTPVQQTARGGSQPITSEVIRTWNSIRQSVLSNDGKWFAYVVGPQTGDGTLTIRGTAQGAREERINLGNGGGSVQVSGDSKWMGYLVGPPTPAGGRGGRGGAGGAGGGRGGAGGGRGAGAPGRGGAGPVTQQAPDSVAAPVEFRFVLRNLQTGDTTVFPRIRRFSFNAEAPTWLVMQGGAAGGGAGGGAGAGGRGGRGGPPGGGGGGGTQSGGDADLLLYNLVTRDPPLNMGRVSQYAFSESGNLLAYTMDNADQVGNAVQVRDMSTGAVRPIASEAVLYRHLAWVDSSRALAVMRGKIQTTGTRDTVFSVSVFRGVGGGAARIMAFSPEGRTDFPTGWKLASDRAPRYSADLSTVFVGIREGIKPNAVPAALPNMGGAPGMGGTINQTQGGGRGGAATDSLAQLILWHVRDDRLQSQQIVQENADRSFNYLVSYRFSDDKFVRLTDSTMRTITVTANDRFAYGSDNREYQQQASFSGRNFADYYVVDLATGARKLLWKKRLQGGITPSPDGTKGLFWGVNGHWWVLDLRTLDSVNITRAVATNFVNVESDNNWIVPPSAGARGWTSDGKYVLLYDLWDIWKVPVSPGSERAVNLTGDGKRNQIRYRTLYSWSDEEEGEEGGGGGGGRGGRGGGGASRGVDLSKPLYIGTYGEWTKKEGVSVVEPGAPAAKTLIFEDARLAITKARNADVYAFTRQTFTEYPDWWMYNTGFREPYRLTNVNPQIQDLAMSAGTRLVDYRTDKGDRLQAAMYLPANFDPSRKYPMLVTIYEKRSQNKNGFVNPSETQTPNARMYTSRGYIVLDPDIVYKINDPGMSAVWAVVPAVKAAIATGIVNEKNVGLWGHSWGGYQTAFLVTQTNIFKAAIAGAALTDMVSMYNSVYWNTGGSNQAIFESSQGRFKGNVAENYEAYIRNSPVFHAHRVTTPLMLLHNDKDGAVNFNQGITYFNALRQMGKEVVMLQYVGENHGVSRPANQRDYAMRMAEWFDHYLMGKPAPDWMKNGVPRLQLTEHLMSRRDTTIAGVRIIAQ